ncbi:MAG: hypothetical protein HQM16_18380 [Deltaproteobacteria bacterium]|nr:hypothetical protein [Deltaproteobacteria bacterium]
MKVSSLAWDLSVCPAAPLNVLARQAPFHHPQNNALRTPGNMPAANTDVYRETIVFRAPGVDTYEQHTNRKPLTLYRSPLAPVSQSITAAKKPELKVIRSVETVFRGTPIHTIMGNSYVTALHGQPVKNVQGIITRIKPNAGFFIQAGSAHPYERSGIFVYTGRMDKTVRVGDLVSIDGIVNEYQPKRMFQSPHAANNNLSSVQIKMENIRVLSRANTLPEPVILHRDHTVIPEQIFTGHAEEGFVETPRVAFNPDIDALAALKSLQGKLVTIKDAVVVEASGPGNHCVVMSESMIPSDCKTPEGGVRIIEGKKYHPARFYVFSTEKVNVGDKIKGNLTGVLDFSPKGMFCIEPTRDFKIAHRPVEFRTTHLEPSPDHLRVASINTENLSLKDDQPGVHNRLARLAEIIVKQALSPDIITLMEIHADPADKDGAVLSSDRTLKALVDHIKKQGGPKYGFRYVEPEAGKDGGKPGAQIRNVFLYRTDNLKRLTFVDSGTRAQHKPTEVKKNKKGQVTGLTHSPGRVKPDDNAFERSRKPLAGHFVFNGHDVFVVTNHLTSKKKDLLQFGRIQPPTRWSEPLQIAQAKASRTLAEALLSHNPEAKVVYTGDLNAYDGSKTLKALTGKDLLFNSSAHYAGADPSSGGSFNFRGLSGNLDHILHSAWLMAHAEPAYDALNENPALYMGHEKRSGDHGMVLARYHLPKKEGGRLKSIFKIPALLKKRAHPAKKTSAG